MFVFCKEDAMQALKEAIRREGVGIGSDIVKVDSFLNHRIDVALSTQMGQAFHEAFADEREYAPRPPRSPPPPSSRRRPGSSTCR